MVTDRDMGVGGEGSPDPLAVVSGGSNHTAQISLLESEEQEDTEQIWARGQDKHAFLLG